MNILIINYDYLPIGAGASNAAAKLAHHLAVLNNNVTVMTAAYKELRGHSLEGNVNVYRIPAARNFHDRSNIWEMISFVRSGFVNLDKIVREQRIEKAIVFYTIPCGPLGYKLKIKFNIPYIISLRGGDVPFHVKQLDFYHKLLKSYRQKLLRNAVHVVANSESFAQLSMKTDPVKVTVIPNGVDADYYSPGEANSTSDKNCFELIFVGRFQPEKNIFFLLASMAELKKQNRNIKLHLVGDGPLLNKIKTSIIDLSLTGTVILHGWLDRESLRNLYRVSNCLVNPSLGEGMPNVVLEAMACGLPVIASNVRGNDALVVHNETGLLFELDKPDDFRKQLLDIMNNTSKAQEMGRFGRDRVIKEFSWEKTARQYADLLSNN